jgi:hypothetical protein
MFQDERTNDDYCIPSTGIRARLRCGARGIRGRLASGSVSHRMVAREGVLAMTTAYRRDAAFWPNSRPGGKMPKYHAESLSGFAPCSRRIMLDPDSAASLSDVPADLRCARCFPEPHDSEANN